MLSCHDVADYFLSLMDEEAGDTISNMKLQKLVYYAQGFSLAIFGRPLFPEKIKAWDHGPVIPELYHKYKDYGPRCIEKPGCIDFSKFDQETRDLLDEVWSVFAQFSAWKLRNMTHVEPPWQNAFESRDQTISEELMHEYFSTLVTKS